MKRFWAALRRHAVLAAAAALCVVHVSSFDVHDQALILDTRYYVYSAWRIAEGDVPHRDLFDNKTQLASFVGAALYGSAERVGADPLVVIRVGSLALTALGGLLLFCIHRRLGASSVTGLLGLAAYCSFGFLGTFASIGNTPKLLMAVLASAGALLAFERRWLWGGVVGALAFMDWQIGALVWLAVFVAACVFGRPRGRSALATIAGGALGTAPFLLYFAVHGALGEAVRQTIVASFFRGTATARSSSLTNRLERISSLVRDACADQSWLFWVSLAGVVIVPWCLWRWRGREEQRLLVPLAVYHLGITAFSLLDFQGYGDVLALLHTSAFFLGIVWVVAHGQLVALVRRTGSGRGLLRFASGATCLVCLVAARPGPLRPATTLPIHQPAYVGVTLRDQQSVAEKLVPQLEGRKVVLLEHCDLLFLTRHRNALPLFYWNTPTWVHYRDSPEESRDATCRRLLLSAEADIVDDLDCAPWPDGHRVVRLKSDSRRYRVELAVRP